MTMRQSLPQFTDSAREVLAKARDEADRLCHEYIGTEHVLLALTVQKQGSAASALHSLHIDTDRIRQTIDETVRRGTASSARGSDLPYTSRTHKVFELAAESANEFGDRQVGVQHLLIGLLREGMGIGAQVLTHHGLSERVCLDELKRLRAAATPPNEVA